MATQLVECPNDGPVEAEIETRTTVPVNVEETLSIVERQAHDVTMGPVTHDNGDPVIVREPVMTRDLIPSGEPREVTVAVCPKCGSPLLVG